MATIVVSDPYEHLSLDRQVRMLQDRGMVVPDLEWAKVRLAHIGYCRLRPYWYTWYEPDGAALESDKIVKRFRPDADFRSVIDTYRFDRELRLLVFAEIERIETSIKTTVIDVFSSALDANWYEHREHFTDPVRHAELFIAIAKSVDRRRQKEDGFVVRAKGSRYPPAWEALQDLSLGQLSKMYYNMKPGPLKKRVAEVYGLDDSVLASWLNTLTEVRNTCAHHSRLWNREILTAPVIPKVVDSQRWITTPDKRSATRVYFSLVMMKYLLLAFMPDTGLTKRIAGLLEAYPKIPRGRMAWPDSWKEEPVWRLGGTENE
ncbi:MAG: Abi family protein [Flavobacteriales bacterium]|nr:MAG: Abi family protein [Flavobacteriales bacterium]